MHPTGASVASGERSGTHGVKVLVRVDGAA